MDKGIIVVRHLSTGEFEEMRWGVSLFSWLHDGRLQTSHAPSQDILDLLFFMIPLTPEINPLTEVLVVGGYTIEDGVISKEKKDLTPKEIEDNTTFSRSMMVVSAWQFKKALTRSGAKRGQVNSFVNNPNTGDSIIDQDIKDGWDSATEYRRLDPTVLSIQSILGWSDSEVDDLFGLAATL